MAILLSCQGLSKSHGSRTLFNDLTFGIFSNDRLGLIGPNGSGKSTLLKMIAGLEKGDQGQLVCNRSLRVGYLAQETSFPEISINDVMWETVKNEPHFSQEQKKAQIAIVLSKMGFTTDSISANSLSGGWKKRLALAMEIVKNPDLLLLDEPTNHLDLEGVLWIEKFLKNAPFAYVVVSHDRYFLENCTNRMMELNATYPKGLFCTEGSYTEFLEKREEFLQGQVQQERSLQSKVRREVEWLKQNPKARTTKSQSRIQEAHRLIGELDDIKQRNIIKKAQMDFASSTKESQKLLTATNIAKSFNNKQLFEGINLVLSPKVRLGIVGLNGSGKTTFLRILAGEITPDKGTIKKADGVKIVYFDQQRIHIPSDISLRNALSPEGDTVIYRGKSIHVNSWCQRFLFSRDRLDLPYGHLSGGEKARVHIARLMLENADILLLDEPTNDLDIPTLEILEDSLQEFPGAIVMISHDRYMLDQISTVILGLGTNSDENLFADYRQWEDFQLRQQAEQKKQPVKEKEIESFSRSERPRKMTYSEKREYEQMEERIIAFENEMNLLSEKIDQKTAAGQPAELHELYQKLEQLTTQLDISYRRWEELEEKK